MLNTSPGLLVSALVSLGLCSQALARDSSLILEEVIVTAQKRTESLADTPLTVSVMTGEQIGELGSFAFSDLTNMTAGLSISGGNFDTDIATRGLGTDLNAAVSPRVTTYFDGTFVAQPRALFSGLYDMQQVELLRGPQGTLYGRSSPAGAITMRSTNPNLDHTDGYFRQSFTDLSGSNTQLGASIPLIKDKLGLRVAGLYDTNENSDAENATLGSDLESETTAFRAVFYWEPTDNLDLRLSYHDIDDDADLGPVVEGNGLEYDDRIAVSDFDSSYTSETEYWILEANYTFANDWEATLVYSKQDNKIRRLLDGDASEVQGREQDVTSPTEDDILEVRLASQGNDLWDWTVGGYIQDAATSTSVDAVTYFIDSRAPFPLRNETSSVAGITTDVKAFFSHNVFNLTDNDIITFGVRYSEVKLDAEQPFLTEVYLLIPDTEGVLVQEILTDGVALADQEQNHDAVTGTLKYQHHFNDDLMAYASYDVGWREGSANISAREMPPEFGAFDPEDSENIELGVKWNLWKGRGLLSVALYYQIYEDFHYEAAGVVHNTPTEGAGQADPVVNVDEAESYGFDTDITVLLSQYWSLSAALSYNKAEFTDASDVPCTTDEPLPSGDWGYNTCDFTGDRAGVLPEWSANLVTEYWGAVSSWESEWYVRGLLNAESEYYSAAFREDLDSYSMLDLYFGLRAATGAWDASVWVKNVTDETALLQNLRTVEIPDYQANMMVDSGYTEIRRQLNPRTIGVTFSYNWGL